jgi:chitodextrinase
MTTLSLIEAHTLGTDGSTATVSVLYAEGVDSDSAPSWDDDDAVEAHLSAELGGEWMLAGEWDAGDHPTRLGAVSTWRRVEAAE